MTLGEIIKSARTRLGWTQAKLAETIGGVEVLWIFPDGSSQSTPGFADLIEEPEES